MNSPDSCVEGNEVSADHLLASTLDLLLIGRSIESNIASVIAQSGLSLLQVNTLYTLSECREGNMRSLADSLACDPSHGFTRLRPVTCDRHN
jgi:hypothetical protein